MSHFPKLDHKGLFSAIQNIGKERLEPVVEMYGPKRDQSTAAGAHASYKQEALERLDMLKHALLDHDSSVAKWGDVGSIAEIHTRLGQALHHAGVAGHTEE